MRLWDDYGVRANAIMAEAVHRHGALAGVETAHAGVFAHNRHTREGAIGPSPRPQSIGDYPAQARAMDKADIREFRRWHRAAVLRAKEAGFDIVYVYVGHGLTLFTDFLSPRINQRSDEYGGSLENRTRLIREVLEETHEAVGDTCAVAIRLCVDELVGPEGISAEDGRGTVELLAEIPDLWDVNAGLVPDDMAPSRFAEQGWEEPHVAFVKQLTSKPVVGVGRFTSPDAMVGQITRGVLDMIGAARPSIADPFLPKKIEEGRSDEIRECIGCNICVSGQYLMSPMRCTQNPTMNEEWRRGWHPEEIAPKGSDARVLVVGAGPAGLEAARALGQRGYLVALAEAGEELGGHLNAVARLPGLAEWIRVRDHRVGRIQEMANVEVYRASRLGAADVREFGAEHVVIATGSHWRRDGVGHRNFFPLPGSDRDTVLTPDEVLAGVPLTDPVVIFDDNHHFMGGALAEMLASDGRAVVLVTPAALASAWTVFTTDQHKVQARLIEAGVEIVANRNLVAVGDGEVELACVFTGRREPRPAGSVVMVAMRASEDALYHELAADRDALGAAGIASLTRIGDCLSPGTIAEAVFAGHRFARELDAEPAGDVPFHVEEVAL